MYEIVKTEFLFINPLTGRHVKVPAGFLMKKYTAIILMIHG